MRALVTGAGKRLGREMALYLARRGYDVAVHYAASRKEAEEVVKEITALGRRACALRADLLIESQVEKLVPMAVQGLGGPLTVLVNNASIFEYDTLRTASRKSWDRHLESNLRAPFVLTQAFAAQAPAAPSLSSCTHVATHVCTSLANSGTFSISQLSKSCLNLPEPCL